MINRIREVLGYTTKRFKRDFNNNITIEKLEEMKNDGSIIVDVRSPQEFGEGHIAGAILIPEYELKNRAKNELPDLEKQIIVYCGTGHRSRRAQKILEKMGYKQVYNLENGWQNY